MDIKDSQSTGEDVQGSNSHIKLAEDALKEALACPTGQASKPFIAALLKLANDLSFKGASQVSTETFLHELVHLTLPRSVQIATSISHACHLQRPSCARGRALKLSWGIDGL